MAREQLLRLAAACPVCGWKPAKRVTRQHVEAVAGVAPGTALDSVKCQHNRCGAVYTITAAAYHEARAE